MTTIVSTLWHDDLGALKRANIPLRDAEGALLALVSQPREAVAHLGECSVEVLDEIVSELAAATDKGMRDGAKKRIPAWVPAEFSGSRRLAAECLGRQVVGHDFDALAADTFEDAVERVVVMLPGRFLAIHTTATERNEDGSWRLRAYEILDVPATPVEWAARVKPHMRGLGEHDANALDVVRLLYLPIQTAGYRFAIIEGARTTLGSLSAVEATDPGRKSESAPTAGVRPAIDTAARILGASWPDAGARCDARLALAGWMFHRGRSEADALAFMSAVHDRVADRGDANEKKLADIVADAYAKGRAGKPVMGRPSLGKYVEPAVLETVERLLAPEVPPELEELFGRKNDSAGAESGVAAASADPDDSVFWDDWDEPYAPPVYLVDGLIPIETVGAFVAKGSSCKTWTALSMGLAVVSGAPWLGRYTTKQGGVLVLDWESGDAELKQRVRLLEGGIARKIPGLGAWSFPAHRLDDEDFWKLVAKIVTARGVSLVIADSLAAGASGVDENDPRAAMPLKLAARITNGTGVSVLFIHHAVKGKASDERDSMRGSGAIYADCDWAYTFESVGENDSGRRDKMVCIKPCKGFKPRPVQLHLSKSGCLSWGEDAPTNAGEGTVGADAKEDDLTMRARIRSEIKMALSTGPLETKELIKQRVRGDRGRVFAEIDALVVTGEIRKIEGVGFILDTDDARQARVYEQVRTFDDWRSPARLADAAYVSRRFVEGMLRKRLIEARVMGGGNGPGGYWVRDPKAA